MDTDRYIKIREELEDIKGMIRDVSYQMQELRDAIRGAPITTQVLPMSEPYVHPWWQYQRAGFIPGRNNLGGSVQATSINLDQTGSGISREKKAA